MEEIVCAIEEAYQSMSVRQALVVVGTDAENEELAYRLKQEGHRVLSVTYEDLQEAEGGHTYHQSRLALYREGDWAARVLIMTYAAWWKLIPILEEYVFQHNLLVLDPDLDSPAQDRVLRWASGCLQRGFWKEGPYRLGIGTRCQEIMLTYDSTWSSRES